MSELAEIGRSSNWYMLGRWFDETGELRPLPIWADYCGAVLLVIATFWVRTRLQTVDVGVILLMLLFPVLFSATLFGGGAGLVATGLAAALAATPSPDGFDTGPIVDAFSLCLFALLGASLTVLIELRRLAYQRLAALNVALHQAERSNALLLQELAHRTKNELQMVRALMSYQARSSKNEEVRAALTAASDRIEVMGRVHAQLSRTGRTGSVDTRAFLEELCRGLQTTLAGTRPVSVECKAEPIELDLDRAIPLGLIANELVTNALKYAFADEASGRIQLRFASEGEFYRLEIQDNGVGLNGEQWTGTGTRLVQLLTLQLGGELERLPGPGTHIRMRFPRRAKRPPTGLTPSRPSTTTAVRRSSSGPARA